NNVLGLLRGSERPDEIVVYMAHWDHLGNDESIDGDGLYNGAADNATGTAAILEIAGAFVSLPQPPKRSILFLAVTAEEQGLLGSAYYGENPVYPKSNTVAAINIDGVNLYGEMNDITIVGMGNSELDDYVTEAAAAQGRVVRPDPEPEKGYFYRSDHFSFAKQGIPALYTDNGIDHVEHGVEWTLERMAEYRAERYHQPTDEFDPNWDVAGALQDIRLLFRVGYRLSNESAFPNWNEGTEFRVLRDAMME
ncbi:MAG: M28 family peptidase, partial [Gemmatimonadetes bacterium]|nr:M28 family peptidase [Gemmatimonadota bacterium]